MRLWLALFCATGALRADSVSALAGSAQPLEAGAQSARDLARGEMGAAGFGQGWRGNPARLGRARAFDIEATHQALRADISRESVTLQVPGGASSGLGASLSWTDFGDIDTRDASGAAAPTLRPSRLGAALAYGMEILTDFWFGAELLVSRSDFGEQRQSTRNFSLGLLYEVTPGFRAGISSLALAAPLRAGFSWLAPPPLGRGEFGLEGEWQQGQMLWKAGAEQPLGGSGLGLRLGCQLEPSAFHWSAGFGTAFRGWRLDYAWRPDTELGDSHSISVGRGF